LRILGSRNIHINKKLLINFDTLEAGKKHSHKLAMLIAAKVAKNADAAGCVQHSFEVSVEWKIQFVRPP
jgi:hypothetical protein